MRRLLRLCPPSWPSVDGTLNGTKLIHTLSNLYPATRSILLPQSGEHSRRGGVRRALPARVRRTRVHAVLEPAPHVRARHRSLHLRRGEHRHVAADCKVSNGVIRCRE